MNFLEQYALRHLLGTKRGDEAIVVIDGNYGESVVALDNGDGAAFLTALPEDKRELVIAAALATTAKTQPVEAVPEVAPV